MGQLFNQGFVMHLYVCRMVDVRGLTQPEQDEDADIARAIEASLLDDLLLSPEPGPQPQPRRSKSPASRGLLWLTLTGSAMRDLRQLSHEWRASASELKEMQRSVFSEPASSLLGTCSTIVVEQVTHNE
jgi:hypothetical protein